MKYSRIPLAQAICTECKNFNIERIVISPGSRNAPLTLSFSADPFFNCYSIVDERSAAFFALGMAQQTNKPVALVCTSGSALLNYYPAIVEAYYAQVPLVVISADRPSYLIDKGDGQTIRQDGVFFNHIGYQVNLIQDCSHASVKWQKGLGITLSSDIEIEQEQESILHSNKRLIRQALESSLESQWPVHLNAPFEEPLYQLEEVADQRTPVKIKSKTTLDYKWDELQEVWDGSKKTLIIIGQCSFDQLSDDLINRLGESDAFLVLTETTSNAHHPNFIERIDSLLVPLEKKNDPQMWLDLQPDLVITIGGAIVSKKIKQFLRTYAPKTHWHWGKNKANDTFFKLTQHLNVSVEELLTKFLSDSKSSHSNAYKTQWTATYNTILSGSEDFVQTLPFSDLQVHVALSKLDLKDVLVHYSNSASIRYAQLFPNMSCHQLHCNRGASGIDGSTSTAVGASIVFKGMTVLVTGDLSFLYDSNAFWNSYIHPNFRVLLINNSGGGIFRILPTSIDDKNFETYFETPHNVNIEALCTAYGISYSTADDKPSLDRELSEFLEPSNKAKVLEVKTPRLINDKVLSDYFAHLSSQIS